MKSNRLYILLLLAISAILNSCSTETIRVTANNTITYRTVDINDFDTIEIVSNFNAYITFSDTEESIEIEANTNLHEYIIATKKDNKLIVKLKDNINVKGRETLNVYITTKSINHFSAVADSKIYLQNTLVTEAAKIKITADSYFLGEIEANSLELVATADARADLSGSCNYLHARLTADAKLSDYSLKVNDLKLRMTADCYVNLTINNSIDIEANADSILRYKGGAAIINEHLTSDSKVIKID